MLEGGGKLDRRQAREVLNLYARESKARTGTFLRGKLISDHGLFFSYEGQQKVANRQDLCEVPRNPLTRWDVSPTPANGIVLTTN